MKSVANSILGASLAFAASPVLAQQDVSPMHEGEVASGCLAEIERIDPSQGQPALAESARRDIRQLKESAKILGEHGREEGCQQIVESIETIIAEHRAEIRSQNQKESLQKASPITEQKQAVRASTIVGTSIRNTEDEELGSIGEVVINPATGEVAYVVLDHGGFVGLGEKRIAVPWDQLRIAETAEDEDRFYVLQTSPESLEQRPGLDDENLPLDVEEWDE